MPEIIFAKKRGFCFGVKRAIELLDNIIKEHGTPIYALNHIVHNRFVVKDFEDKGVVFIKAVEEYADKTKKAPIIISAHGVSKKVLEEINEKGVSIYDLTCPFVTSIHKEIEENKKQGLQTILIGTDRNHDEVKGTLGQGEEGEIAFVQSKEDIVKLKDWIKESEKLSYVTQTTLTVEKTEEVIKSLKTVFPKIKKQVANICKATSDRQQAVKDLIREENLDMLLVIGDRNSSNTQKLKDIAKKEAAEKGCEIYIAAIESKQDLKLLDREKLKSASLIGVTSGASTPEYLVEEVVKELQSGV